MRQVTEWVPGTTWSVGGNGACPATPLTRILAILLLVAGIPTLLGEIIVVSIEAMIGDDIITLPLAIACVASLAAVIAGVLLLWRSWNRSVGLGYEDPQGDALPDPEVDFDAAMAEANPSPLKDRG